MNRRSIFSVLGAVVFSILLTGTARLQWNENQIVQGPPIALDVSVTSQEFNVDLGLEMCEPGPEEEPVSLFMDLSAGFELVEFADDTAVVPSEDGTSVIVTIYPADGTAPITDMADLSSGSGGVYLSSSQISCPAHGMCERGYIVVFEVSDGSTVTGWWNLTASALGPNKSEGEYEGRISLEIEAR